MTIANRPAPGGEHDIVQALALFEVASDQEAKAARQLKHPDERLVLGAIGVVEPAIGGFRPARGFKNAGGKRADIAGEPLARARW